VFTETFYKTAQAYNDGYRIIENRGGTRSGKTYGELQLLDIIINKPKPRVITTVSHSLPHLIGGAIRDYDHILLEKGIQPDMVRTKNPYVYKFGNSIHEFIGFDNPGKALGAARDILFINEANKMDWGVCHQLMQRTTETIFIDYNPSNKFWNEQLSDRKDRVVISSTFRDNYMNLTDGQISDFLEAKKKADAEAAKGIYGYWSNWWKVYGEGEYGQVEGAIFNNWEIGEFDRTLPTRCGLDFGFSNDPDALIRIAVDEKRKLIYCEELMYKTGQSTEMLISTMRGCLKQHEKIFADYAEGRLINDLKKHFNIAPCVKWHVVDRIKKLQSYQFIVTKESTNLINELTEYVWNDKKSETPIDKNNHLIDALSYAFINGISRVNTSATF
jgi:phage terminase large subunit